MRPLAPGLDFFDGCDEYDWPPDTPVLLLIHGLAGSSEDAYCKWMAATATAKGWRAAVLNYRVRWGYINTLTQNPEALADNWKHLPRQGAGGMLLTSCHVTLIHNPRLLAY